MEQVITIDQTLDSLELGKINETGKLKIYFDSIRIRDAKIRIDNALEIRKYANDIIDGV